MSLVPVEEALKRLLSGKPLTDVETVSLHDAYGRVLGEDLVATRNQPPFPASAMDGYALRAADADIAGRTLTVIGQSAAGHGFSGRLGAGETVRIFTGAPVPEGADAILIQENAEVPAEGTVRAVEPAEAGRHIRAEGIDFRKGETVLSRGTVFDAGALTLAAALNRAEVPLIRRPRVAVLATGDELVPPGNEPRAEQIIASSIYGVAAIAREVGAEVIDLGIAPDRMDALAAAIETARGHSADILVTLGGASVGDHDLVQAALKEAGMKLDFWKIAMRPGKPLMSGHLGEMQVLGMPGNPVSTLVCGHLFLEPLVAHLGGRPAPSRLATAVLARDLPANDQRQDYVRTRLSRRADGEIVADPFDRQDSSMMRIFATADGLIVRPPHAPAAKAGERAQIMLLKRL